MLAVNDSTEEEAKAFKCQCTFDPKLPKHLDSLSDFNHFCIIFFHFTSIRTVHANFAEEIDVGLEKYDRFFTVPADSTFSLLNYMSQKC